MVSGKNFRIHSVFLSREEDRMNTALELAFVPVGIEGIGDVAEHGLSLAGADRSRPMRKEGLLNQGGVEEIPSPVEADLPGELSDLEVLDVEASGDLEDPSRAYQGVAQLVDAMQGFTHAVNTHCLVEEIVELGKARRQWNSDGDAAPGEGDPNEFGEPLFDLAPRDEAMAADGSAKDIVRVGEATDPLLNEEDAPLQLLADSQARRIEHRTRRVEGHDTGPLGQDLAPFNGDVATARLGDEHRRPTRFGQKLPTTLKDGLRPKPLDDVAVGDCRLMIYCRIVHDPSKC